MHSNQLSTLRNSVLTFSLSQNKTEKKNSLWFDKVGVIRYDTDVNLDFSHKLVLWTYRNYLSIQKKRTKDEVKYCGPFYSLDLFVEEKVGITGKPSGTISREKAHRIPRKHILYTYYVLRVWCKRIFDGC